jgi:hypothetical protein
VADRRRQDALRSCDAIDHIAPVDARDTVDDRQGMLAIARQRDELRSRRMYLLPIATPTLSAEIPATESGDSCR